jgi:cytochrome oxidase Cu insertion factor (SCO1/SenC/PrrC family)
LNADFSNWHFLTGNIETIKTLAVKSLKVGHNDEISEHTTRIVLIDGKGAVRGYYSALDEDAVARIVQDFKKLS